MTMCAAITVPIIKDGYRLYPGMPVSNRGGNIATSSQPQSNRSRTNSQTLYFNQQSPISGSPPEGGSMAPLASSPPSCANGTGAIRSGIIVGGAAGGGVHHQVVLLQPRPRTSAQSQMTARSSFEVGPTSMSDSSSHRTAVSTSQLYIQKRRERCIQQQLEKQELERKQAQMQQLQQQQRRSLAADQPMDRCDSASIDEQRKRKTSPGDHNNNSDSEPSKFRKLLRIFGFGGGPANVNAQQRHVSFQEAISGDCESGIEQAISATESTPLAVTAWH